MTITIVGEFDNSNSTHIATNNALEHAELAYGKPVDSQWVSTARIVPEIIAV